MRRSADIRKLSRNLFTIRAFGFNYIQPINDPPDPIELDICDRLGLLVIFDAKSIIPVS